MTDGPESDPRDELLALSVALRDHLTRSAADGVLEEFVDADVPHADPEVLSALEDAALPAAAEVAPEEPSEDEWGRLAAKERELRVPTHHKDGMGAVGLAAIREDLGECTRCGLCEGRRQIVFGAGDPEADLMVIGEGPGEQEDRQGEPFVGPAGEMLDKMLLHVLGLPRERVYIANIVKCRPPGNRNPSDAEASTCLPFLQRQIRAVRPRVILVLGAVALQHLCDVRGIKRHRGVERTVEGIPTIPTFHPAYLLRNEADKRLTFEDLKRLRVRYDALGGRR